MMPSLKTHLEKRAYEKVVSETDRRNSLSSNASSETLLEDGLHPEDLKGIHVVKVKQTPRWMWFTHAALISISAAFFVAAWFGADQTYVHKFSAWSPALGDVRYETVHYNLSMGYTSPYMGASPDVDKKWNALAYDVGDQMVSSEQMKQMGKPMDSVTVTNPKTGEQGYRVSLEVFHQLHCLNLLRKNTYRDYYVPLGGDLADPPEKQRWHMDHCIEIIRLALMCSSDVGVFTYHTLDNFEVDWHPKTKPWPDYNRPHVCRSFDAIRDWAMDNTVTRDDDSGN